jgi:hypothetical protein
LEAHFYGKIRKQWGAKNDFLALCVTGKGMDKEKILGDIPIPKGTGKAMAQAVVKMLREWGIDVVDVREDGSGPIVIAICFDTTSSNTGVEKGNLLI